MYKHVKTYKKYANCCAKHHFNAKANKTVLLRAKKIKIKHSKNNFNIFCSRFLRKKCKNSLLAKQHTRARSLFLSFYSFYFYFSTHKALQPFTFSGFFAGQHQKGKNLYTIFIFLFFSLLYSFLCVFLHRICVHLFRSKNDRKTSTHIRVNGVTIDAHTMK